jgi:metal-responsive CopG/Arc/MetJ family transcriptional regulator
MANAKDPRERHYSLTISLPLSLVNKIDDLNSDRPGGRSKFVREAIAEHFARYQTR